MATGYHGGTSRLLCAEDGPIYPDLDLTQGIGLSPTCDGITDDDIIFPPNGWVFVHEPNGSVDARWQHVHPWVGYDNHFCYENPAGTLATRDYSLGNGSFSIEAYCRLTRMNTGAGVISPPKYGRSAYIGIQEDINGGPNSNFPPGAGTAGAFISFGHNNQLRAFFQTAGDPVVEISQGATIQLPGAGGATEPVQWIHAAVNFARGGNMELFFNGVSLGTAAIGAVTALNTKPFVHHDAAGITSRGGMIYGSMALHNRILTQTELNNAVAAKEVNGLGSGTTLFKYRARDTIFMDGVTLLVNDDDGNDMDVMCASEAYGTTRTNGECVPLTGGDITYRSSRECNAVDTTLTHIIPDVSGNGNHAHVYNRWARFGYFV